MKLSKGPNELRGGEGVRVRFIKVTRCHLIPDRELIGYNAKGGIFIQILGFMHHGVNTSRGKVM